MFGDEFVERCNNKLRTIDDPEIRELAWLRVTPSTLCNKEQVMSDGQRIPWLFNTWKSFKREHKEIVETVGINFTTEEALLCVMFSKYTL